MPALQRALIGNTGAHSAVEMALLDLAGRASGMRLIDLVGGRCAQRVTPMWLLGNATVEQDIAEAQAKEREGFHFFKLKIGVKPLPTKSRPRIAVREALPETPLCADANCGLTLAAASAMSSAPATPSSLFFEQPLRA